MTGQDQKVCTSSCAFAKVADDLLVIRELFGNKPTLQEGHPEETVTMGKYSKRIISGLVVILIISIILGGRFIRVIDDESKSENPILRMSNNATVMFDNQIDVKSQQRMCGNMESYVNRKIFVDGNVTPPWYVSIWMTDGTQYSFNCGGTLVGSWIISSAHCFIPDADYLNTHSTRSKSVIELTPVLDRLVLFGNQSVFDPDFNPNKNPRVFKLDTPMFIPTNFNFLTFQNDLIAVRIPKNVPKSMIVPLCFQKLPDNDFGTKCWISGPALTSRRTEYGHVRSDWVWLKNCSQTVQHVSDISEWSVCAGRDGTESCRGDSGGPLACYNPQSRIWEAIGLISWSNQPCAKDRFKTDVHTKLM